MSLPVTRSTSGVVYSPSRMASAGLPLSERSVTFGVENVTPPDGTGYVPLTFDTSPGYVDTQLFPAAPAKWTYKAIYRADDAQVGHWSQPVSVTVGG